MDYIVTPNEARQFLERLPRATPQLQELTQHIMNCMRCLSSSSASHGRQLGLTLWNAVLAYQGRPGIL
jgi:hypothetical protein